MNLGRCMIPSLDPHPLRIAAKNSGDVAEVVIVRPAHPDIHCNIGACTAWCCMVSLRLQYRTASSSHHEASLARDIVHCDEVILPNF